MFQLPTTYLWLMATNIGQRRYKVFSSLQEILLDIAGIGSQEKARLRAETKAII